MTLGLRGLKLLTARGGFHFSLNCGENTSLQNIDMLANELRYNVKIENLLGHPIPLCDKTSIESIYNSSHSLVEVRKSPEVSPD